jgi:farnesyl-diphosphate farnesyltransferase
MTAGVVLDVDDLLQKTSRTFALAIPLLPEPTRRSVSLAYLLFRVADTVEDATEWSRTERVDALGELARVKDVSAATSLRERWVKQPPCHHAGYMELIGNMPELFTALDGLAPAARAIVMRHAARTIEGMASIVTRGSEHGRVALATLAELRDYCYLVAGIVGELLTELFLNDAPQLERERVDLEANTRLFGEGLQLVNILKDERSDAGDGRTYLPPGVARSEVITLARSDLDGAKRYIAALTRGGAPGGYVAFTSLCTDLAVASLDKLEAGAKLSRDEVFAILSKVSRFEA